MTACGGRSWSCSPKTCRSTWLLTKKRLTESRHACRAPACAAAGEQLPGRCGTSRIGGACRELLSRARRSRWTSFASTRPGREGRSSTIRFGAGTPTRWNIAWFTAASSSSASGRPLRRHHCRRSPLDSGASIRLRASKPASVAAPADEDVSSKGSGAGSDRDGVAYHVIPRFIGKPLHTRRLATWHWWTSNCRLALMVVGFVVRPTGDMLGATLLSIGGTLAAAGAYMFVYNIWRTLGSVTSVGSVPRRPLVPLVGSRAGPTAGR